MTTPSIDGYSAGEAADRHRGKPICLGAVAELTRAIKAPADPAAIA